MRIVYMGTPDIAATCLKQLLADGFDVAAVYTAASPRARTLNSGRLAQPCFWHFGGQRALDHLLGQRTGIAKNNF